ncbi:MAG: GAF domain-containing sensor histidine kinase [Aquabacterium sp.]|nr:MAG: GAF domain-containing sensor histidine kinase [Aquabacterium sp.]
MSSASSQAPRPAGEPVADGDSSFDAARLRLSRLHVADGKPLRAVFHEAVSDVAQALGVRRVGIWLFAEDRRSIRCDCLYQHPHQELLAGTVLHEQDFPNYFSALQHRRVVAVEDVEGEPITEEFREPYLRPLGISAMLDAPIYRDGEIIGIVCHEHVGAPRHWTPAECEFAAAVADTIARLHAESARHLAEHSLEAFHAHARQLEQAGVIGRLASGVAHDFKNVLNGVIGFADLIADAAGPNQQVQSLVQGLVKAVDLGNRLTQDLLSLGQDRPSRPGVVDVAQVLRRQADLLRVSADGVGLKLEIVEPLSRVFIDRAHLERAVLNLVVNARDAMPGHSGRIRVHVQEAHRRTSAGDDALYVMLEVADTGVGIPSEIRERLFEPYVTTKGDKGTGLGLTLVHRMVALAGGFIEVDSELGEGTSIRLYLPRITAGS